MQLPTSSRAAAEKDSRCGRAAWGSGRPSACTRLDILSSTTRSSLHMPSSPATPTGEMWLVGGHPARHDEPLQRREALAESQEEAVVDLLQGHALQGQAPQFQKGSSLCRSSAAVSSEPAWTVSEPANSGSRPDHDRQTHARSPLATPREASLSTSTRGSRVSR